MQKKKLLGLKVKRYQIFSQGSCFFVFLFFCVSGVGGRLFKAIWRIVRTSEKILATPLESRT